MRLLAGGGQRGVTRIVRSLAKRGYAFEQSFNQGATRAWRMALDAPPRDLTLQTFSGAGVRATHVLYQARPEVRLTPRQRTAQRLQESFYQRYIEVGQRAYTTKPTPRLSRDDRLVLLIGELEADVNNGGFEQYLDNKGRRRAREALAALRRAGATKTAGMLATAMAPGATRGVLQRLDRQFYRVPEDLAVLTMRYLERRRG
ncbi:MAG: DUF4375 domain-containing protein [Gemmatimonadetes bacterium]|nr:DUF4375 domain-containing protein [Gemmatimonadota bacterium]